MVMGPTPSVLQWSGYRPAPQTKPLNESSDLFPTISTSEAIVNPQQQNGSITNIAQSPVNQIQHQHSQQHHDFNSPTSTNSSFSQAKNQSFDDYRYSHTSTNWLYGPGANVHPGHQHPEFQLDPQHNTTSFDDVGTNFNGEEASKPRTESSLTSMSSPEYSSLLEDDNGSPKSMRGRSSSTQSAKGKVHKDATGKTKRSRMGCLTCRHRKKRCCERRPKCQECERLRLKCTWPVPGLEHRNRPKNAKMNEDMHYDAFYGPIKILRGIVEYRINATS